MRRDCVKGQSALPRHGVVILARGWRRRSIDGPRINLSYLGGPGPESGSVDLAEGGGCLGGGGAPCLRGRQQVRLSTLRAVRRLYGPATPTVSVSVKGRFNRDGPVRPVRAEDAVPCISVTHGEASDTAVRSWATGGVKAPSRVFKEERGSSQPELSSSLAKGHPASASAAVERRGATAGASLEDDAVGEGTTSVPEAVGLARLPVGRPRRGSTT